MAQKVTAIKNNKSLLKCKDDNIKTKHLLDAKEITQLERNLAKSNKIILKLTKENDKLKKVRAKRQAKVKKQKTKKEIAEQKKIELAKKKQKAAAKKEQNIKTRQRTKDQKDCEHFFITLLCEYIKIEYPQIFVNTRGNRKHSIEVIITEIFEFLKSGTSYKSHQGKLKKTTLNNYVIFFTKANIYQRFYWHLHKKYATKNLADNLKNQSTDTSFIVNQYGLEADTARNPFMKNKNCIKISLVVDANGVPFDIKFVKGNRNDGPLLREHINEMTFNTNTKKYINSNRFKQTFMADAGYDCIENVTLLKEKGYHVIIPINKRNTKEEVSQTSKMTEKDKETYKKRTIVENKFSNYKQFRRVAKIYDRCKKNYESFAHLALSKLLFNLLVNEKIYNDILCKI